MHKIISLILFYRNNIGLLNVSEMWTLLVAVLYTLILPSWATLNWAVDFSPKQLLKMKMSDSAVVNFSTVNLTTEEKATGTVYFYSRNSGIATVNPEFVYLKTQNITNKWSSSFNVTANFIGYDDIEMVLKGKNSVIKLNILMYSKVIKHDGHCFI